MRCDCTEKVKKLREKIHSAELKVAKEEREEGPFWARWNMANSMEKLRDEISEVNCKCKEAQIINNIFTLLNDTDVIRVISENFGGGRTTEDRTNQEINFQNLCSLSKGLCITKTYSSKPEAEDFCAGVKKIATVRDTVTGKSVPSMKRY